MSRVIHADTLAAISNPAGFNPVIAVFVDWPDDPVYAHSGLGVLSWGGKSWSPVGDLGGLALPEDLSDFGSDPAFLGIAGLDATLDKYADNLAARGCDIVVYFGAVTERAGSVVIGDLFEVWTGTLDSPEENIAPAGTGRTRGVMLEATPGPSQRSAAPRRHSFEDQSARHAGDTFFKALKGIEARIKKMRYGP